MLPMCGVRTSGLLNWERTHFSCSKPAGGSELQQPEGSDSGPGRGLLTQLRAASTPCPPTAGGGQPAAGPDDTALLLVCSQVVTTWYRGCRHRNGKPGARWLCKGFTGRPPFEKFTSLHFSQFLEEKNVMIKNKVMV